MGSIVTVFGGTGFLGRRVVQHLRERQYSVRIASRHPDRGRIQFGIEDPQLQTIEADIHDERSVTDALAGADGVVNAVTLTLSAEGTRSILCTWSRLNGWQSKRTELEFSGSSMFRESVLMLPSPAVGEVRVGHQS